MRVMGNPLEFATICLQAHAAKSVSISSRIVKKNQKLADFWRNTLKTKSTRHGSTQNPALSPFLRSFLCQAPLGTKKTVLLVQKTTKNALKITDFHCWKCWIWRSNGTNYTLLWVLRGVWYKKGPQKWTQRGVLRRSMSCRLFFLSISSKYREFLIFCYDPWAYWYTFGCMCL